MLAEEHGTPKQWLDIEQQPTRRADRAYSDYCSVVGIVFLSLFFSVEHSPGPVDG